MAMPTGTRNSIRANRLTKPMMATASVLICASLHRLDGLLVALDLFRIEHEPIRADCDQNHRRDVAGPGNGIERPSRQAKIEGQDIVAIGADHLVDQRV